MHEGKVADYLQEQLSLEETEGGLEVKCCRYSSYTQKVSFRIAFCICPSVDTGVFDCATFSAKV